MGFGTMTGGYIEKGVLCRTTAYHTQYRRPLHANFGQNVNALMEVTAGHDFSKERLAPIAATSLTMATQIEGEAGIAGGWNQERCLFALKIVHSSNEAGTMKTVQYLMGYTDHMGIQHGGFGIVQGGRLGIDPNMRLFFNSSIVYQEMTVLNGYGMPETTITPLATDQLLTGVQGSMYGQSTYTMRPEDVYSMMHSQELVSSVNRYHQNAAQPGAGANIQDGRVMFQPGQPLKKSSRSNLIPSNYLSKLLTNTSNILTTYQGEHSTNQETANRISSSLSEGYINNDQTLSMFLSRTGLIENGSITYRELCTLFSNADATIIRAGTESQKVQGAQGTNSEYMNGAQWDLIIAQMLQNVTTALMMENSLNRIVIRGDNYTASNTTQGIVGGTFKLDALWGGSFIDGKPTEFACEQVKNRLVSEFLSGFTGHNYVPIGFTIQVNLYGECVVDISYNMQPIVRYVTPMFGDSLFSPVLTEQRSTLASLSAETRSMTHGLFNVM
ncbi:hypothetical protein pEaSNUABM37_00279 [Erwinia phage pEa_SNUABM_37]|nr:hypothetical protein pEaSNUABM37_00279 [Erwinia phage pEa_SNUABM_37]QXO10747.1 hypothetical protein pEaSNUABM48_00279 [Erwinia phage pEa_SNUABM_48]